MELRQRADAAKRKAEEEAFDALPNPEQEKWLQRAFAELSPVLRGSKKAIRCMAIELFSRGLLDMKNKAYEGNGHE